MKVRVNPHRCQGHTMCALACPELFRFDEHDGHAYVENEQVPVELEDKVRLAQSACPEEAIELEG